jgi:hypothetical protein
MAEIFLWTKLQLCKCIPHWDTCACLSTLRFAQTEHLQKTIQALFNLTKGTNKITNMFIKDSMGFCKLNVMRLLKNPSPGDHEPHSNLAVSILSSLVVLARAMLDLDVMLDVMVWALLRSTLVRVGIAHVRSSIYVAQPTSDSQFSAVLLLSSHRYTRPCFLATVELAA